MTHEKSAIRTNTHGQKSKNFPANSPLKNCQKMPFFDRFDTQVDTFSLHNSDILTGCNLTEAQTVCHDDKPPLLTSKNLGHSRANDSVHISTLLFDYWKRLRFQSITDVYSPRSGTSLDTRFITLQNAAL